MGSPRPLTLWGSVYGGNRAGYFLSSPLSNVFSPQTLTQNVHFFSIRTILPRMSPEMHFGQVEIYTWSDFVDVILLGMIVTPRNLVVILATWFLVRAISHAFPHRGAIHRGLHRARELIYIGCCSALVWAPGLRPEIESWGYRVGLGVLLGGVTSFVPWGLHLLGQRFGVDLLKDPRKAK